MELPKRPARLIHWIKSRTGIPLFSWSRPGIANFGDELNKLLIPALSGRAVFCVPANCSLPHLAAIGSVLHLVGPGATVWGSGAISHEHPLTPSAKIRAVRGPLTRARVLDQGIDCPEIYGDPALLTPLVYTPRRTASRKALGIVPHYVDYEHVRRRFPDTYVIDVRQPTTKVIDELAACDNVVSSSLHGVIIAEVFGVKARWARFSDDLIGGAFKFQDYYQSVGIHDAAALNLVKTTASEQELIRRVQNDWQAPQLDLGPLLRAAPFTLTPDLRRGPAVGPLPLEALRQP
jgi:pyruvyltransferase